MASSSTQKPSSSSSSSSSAPTGKVIFDVFLSFRGEDTRYNFTDHLFVDLDRMGINTFIDDQLERGEEIAQELFGTIEGSRFSIIVFSKKYADSKWCLDELTKIMECRKELGQIVLPVFYHVDPSNVRKQAGSFGEAFAKHETTVDEEKVQKWRAAMTEAGSLSGWHVKDDESESKPIKEIIDRILKRLNPKHLHVEEHMAGMNCRLEELKSLLSIHLDDIRVVGVYGIGGVGKTTIAKMVYNDILCEFDGSSFLEDVKSRSKNYKDRLKLLQGLLCGILLEKNLKLKDIDDGINMIKSRLGSKKVLVIIDDVDDLDQVKSLIADCKWLGSGSRIIITTRNRGLLDEYGVHGLYEAKVLCYEESIELFSWHAFKVQNIPKADYMNLSECMVHYAQGLPLALKVLGSSLRGMKIDEWEGRLDKLKNNPDKKINDVLRISLRGLDDSQKDVFLDIACFLKGKDRDFVSKILACDNSSTKYDIRVLYNRCVITIQNNMIQMHDLIQQMGWAIVREECPKDPSKWSRLWDPKDLYDAFSRQKGMKNVESISLDLSISKAQWFNSKVFAKMKEVFAKMTKLRFLELYYSDGDVYKMPLPKDFEFPSSLRYLHWEGLECMPLNFRGENIVAISLKSSGMKKLWKGNECLKKLKFLDLSDSQQLAIIPKFSSMPNLERLNLGGCRCLHKFHSFIGVEIKFLRELYLNGTGIKELPSGFRYLESLEILDLSKCSKFEKFPDIFANLGRLWQLRLNGSGIKELPSGIRYLESLAILDLLECSKFEKFPNIFANLGRLRELWLNGSGIKELSNSIRYCKSLVLLLSLLRCSEFEKFPDIFANLGPLQELWLRGSGIKELPNSIGYLGSLEILDLPECLKFEKLPDIFANLGHLRRLVLKGSGIKELPNSIGYCKSLQSLDLSGCSEFEKFPDIFANLGRLRELWLMGSGIKELPNSIGYLGSLEILNLSECSKFEKFPEIQGNMKCLKSLFLSNTAIKELPNSIGSLRALEKLYLENTGIKELPNAIGCLEVLKDLCVRGCSNIETLPEIQRNMGSLRFLDLSNTAIKELPYSIGHLTGLEGFYLGWCKNLRSLPSSIGNLTCLETLVLYNCSKLHKLPDNLRNLQCCLKSLSLNGCKMADDAFPSDLWCLYSLKSLFLSRNHIRRIPAGIIQLSKLKLLGIYNCLELEEIPELPSSLRRIIVQGGPRLETLSSPSHILWSSLLNCFKSFIQDFRCQRQCLEYPLDVDIPGSGGIPEWVSHKSMGCEIRIELPSNWYEDDNFLGFALFTHGDPLVDYEGKPSFTIPCKLSIISLDHSVRVVKSPSRWYGMRDLGPGLHLRYFPQIGISEEYRSSRWRHFKADFFAMPRWADDKYFIVKSCGIHLIYAGNNHQQI